MKEDLGRYGSIEPCLDGDAAGEDVKTDEPRRGSGLEEAEETLKPNP